MILIKKQMRYSGNKKKGESTENIKMCVRYTIQVNKFYLVLVKAPPKKRDNE